MKRRVHPRVQMLHGARLAVTHLRDRSRLAPHDAELITDLHVEEYGALTKYGKAAYHHGMRYPARAQLAKVLNVARRSG